MINSSLSFQKGTFWGKCLHSNMIFTQNLKIIYADMSAASAEFLMSALPMSDVTKHIPEIISDIIMIDYPSQVLYWLFYHRDLSAYIRSEQKPPLNIWAISIFNPFPPNFQQLGGKTHIFTNMMKYKRRVICVLIIIMSIKCHPR